MVSVPHQNVESNRRRALPTTLSQETFATQLAFWAFSALLLAVAMLPLLAVGNVSGQGNTWRQIVYLAIAATAFISAQLSSRSHRLLVIPPAIVVLLLWALLSLSWAINPDVASRRLFLTILIVVTVFVLVREIGYRLSVAAMRIVLPALLLANYLTVLLWPAIGIHQTLIEGDPSVVGAWHGILMDKNFTGAICSFTVLVFVLDADRLNAWFRVLVIAGATYFLWRTNSKTSLALLLISMLLSQLSARYESRWAIVFLHALFFIIVGVCLAAYMSTDAINSFFSREDSLTGRVQIWPLLIRFIQSNWMLGSGFGSFWNIGGSEPIYQYTRGWISKIASGHNGYLDLTVQLGIPGLALLLWAVVIAPGKRLVFSAALKSPSNRLPAAIITFAILHNLTETSFFDRDAAVHVFLICGIAMLYLDQKHQ